MVKDAVADLIARFEKTGPRFTIGDMRDDPTVCVELDRMVLEALDELVEKKVKSPLAAMAVWLTFREKENDSHAAKLVSYRVCGTAALLGQYKWLKRLADEGRDLDSQSRQPRTLFEVQNGMGKEMTFREKFDLVRKHLTIRGVLKQRPKARGGAR